MKLSINSYLKFNGLCFVFSLLFALTTHTQSKVNQLDKLLNKYQETYEVLESYVGEYELQPGFSLTISKEGKQMKAKATGQGIVDIFPKSVDRFYLKVIEAQIQFNKAEDGNIESLTLFQAGREMEEKRLTE